MQENVTSFCFHYEICEDQHLPGVGIWRTETALCILFMMWPRTAAKKELDRQPVVAETGTGLGVERPGSTSTRRAALGKSHTSPNLAPEELYYLPCLLPMVFS